MEQEFITAREACKILGVSRAMVQKLMASGELERATQNGRLVFERAKVEALAQARDVAKVQRAQDAEDRQQRDGEVQQRRDKVEFEACAKSADDQDLRQLYEASQARISNQLEQIRAKLRAMEEAEAHRRFEATLDALGSRKSAPSTDGQLLDALTALAPAAIVLGLAYWAGKPPRSSPSASSVELPQANHEGAGDAAPVWAQVRDQPDESTERLLIRKVMDLTATPEDLQQLAAMASRRFRGNS
jgi:excisionase family DNA binding protein